jgi:branched-chain amino acid transport system substrate-binding protein
MDDSGQKPDSRIQGLLWIPAFARNDGFELFLDKLLGTCSSLGQTQGEWEGVGMRKALLSVVLVSLCAVAPRVNGAEQLKIGYIATMSGPTASLGTDILDGFKLGIKHCGDKLGGLPVELVIGDDQLKSDIGVQVANRMIEKDKVDLVTGIVFSNVMMAVAKPITDAGLFLISANAGPSPLAGEGCVPNFFAVSWQNDQTHEAMGKYLQDQGVKSLYLMAPNYQAGKDGLAGVKRYFKGQIVGEVYTKINQPDYAAELAQLRAAKPEALFVFYPGGMGINFVKQYAQSGLKEEIPLYTSGPSQQPNGMEGLPKLPPA